jgi:hypothetical protein
LTIGETNVLSIDDSGKANYLLAQNATLPQAAAIRSLSFYVARAAGNLRLGIYDASGWAGHPGSKKAETPSFKPTIGWNTVNVISPVSLAAGNYWLAYLSNNNNLHFVRGASGGASSVYYQYNFGMMPSTFRRNVATTPYNWSLYATLNGNGGGSGGTGGSGAGGSATGGIGAGGAAGQLSTGGLGAGGTRTGGISGGGGSAGRDAGLGGVGTGGRDAGAAGGGATGVGGRQAGGLFEKSEPWTKDISGLSPNARSSAIITALNDLGGWGNGRFQIDFSIPLFFGDSSTPRQTISAPSGGYCYGGPDCDPVPLQMPLPSGGNTEGSSDYTCDTGNNDCHILVVERSQKKLYELYNATKTASGFTALGAFVWDLTKAYPDNERGDQCTSADAGGFPIAGLLATADEVAAGTVAHAIRFILPNQRMKKGVYVQPASHAGAPSSTNKDAPPYGVRFRLKASFDESLYGAGPRVILRAMKTYGMLLSDGGNIALTFADDRTTTAKWSDVGITPLSFSALKVTDFEVVDLNSEITITNNCVRNP